MSGRIISLFTFTQILLLSAMETNTPPLTLNPTNSTMSTQPKDVSSRALVDPNIILIWFISVFIVVLGGYYPNSTIKTQPSQISAIKLIPVIAVTACVVVLLLYFFHKYAVYFIIAVFAIAALQGTFVCMHHMVNHCCPCLAEYKVPVIIPGIRSHLQIVSIPLFIISACLSISWVVFRNNCNIWILHVLLAVCLCITLIGEKFITNLKSGIILLTVMVVYDVFMVFITPSITKGKSIMEKVALGPSAEEGSKENIPIVIKIPQLLHGTSSLCGKSFILLGLGDIILPGLFVSFCRRFDKFALSKFSVYFTTCVIGYGIGVFLAFLGVFLMQSAQPALIYICPSMLLGVTCIGLCRGETGKLWKGINCENTEQMNTELDAMAPCIEN